MGFLESPRRHVTSPCQPSEIQGLIVLPLPVLFLQMLGLFCGLPFPHQPKGAPDPEPIELLQEHQVVLLDIRPRKRDENLCCL